jgi:PKHD-type hydroxylase
LVNQKYYPLTKIKLNPVICVENLFSDEELEKLCQQLDNLKIQPAFVGGIEPSADDETHKIRKSNICFIEEDSFNWVYDKLTTAVNYVNSTNYNKTLYGIEPLQYTEYDSSYNGFYATHKDENEFEINIGLLRKLSFTMQLSREEDYTGGSLIIHNNEPIISSKKFGNITFFDSSIPHEVTPVETGIRKSLVGWIVGPRV